MRAPRRAQFVSAAALGPLLGVLGRAGAFVFGMNACIRASCEDGERNVIYWIIFVDLCAPGVK